MATMSFCGADGERFRGREVTTVTKWRGCQDWRRPTSGSCLDCRLYLAGTRSHSGEPYRWRGIPVSGQRGKVGRLHAGQLARVGVTVRSP